MRDYSLLALGLLTRAGDLRRFIRTVRREVIYQSRFVSMRSSGRPILVTNQDGVMATIQRFLPDSTSDDDLPLKKKTLLQRKVRQREIRRKEDQRKSGRADVRNGALSPRRWLGVFLVLTSLLGGYLTVSHADKRTSILALRTNLAAGQMISAEDVAVIKAAMPLGRYATSQEQVVGQSLVADHRAGEVIALSQIAQPTSRNLIAVAVKTVSLPPLSRGDRVEVWAQGLRVAADLAVYEVRKEATTTVVTVEVSTELTPLVVAALAEEVAVVKSA